MWHFAGIDWTAWLAELKAWQPLSIFARRTVLDQLHPDLPIVTARLSGHLDILKAHGWIPPPVGRLPRRVPESRRPLLALLRAMDRARLFETADHAAMVAYLRAHADPDALAHGLGRPDTTLDMLAHLIEDDKGLPAFLAHEDSATWARKRWPQTDLPRRLTDAGSESRQLVTWLCEQRWPITLSERHLYDFPFDDPAFGRAMAATLPACLTFIALRGSDLEPVIGCWPPAASRVRRRRARLEPRTVEPVSHGGSATEGDHAGLIDLTNLVAACAANPPRLKAGNFQLFKRARTDLAELLMPLAPWLASLLATTPERRVDDMITALQQLGFLCPKGAIGKDLRLAPTDAGRAWLKDDDATRLCALLDLLREIRAAVAARDHEHPRHPFNGHFRYTPPSVDHFFSDENTRTEHLVLAFTGLETGCFVELETYLDHRATIDNPLPAWSQSFHRSAGRWRETPLDDEALERLWAYQLRNFLLDRLFLLGGAQIGRTAEGHIAFAITEAGHYLLGTTESFTLEAPADTARLIVQPSFEVVFLAPSPLVEGHLARIAERVGEGGVGVLFRLTRLAAQRAAAAGLTSDEAVAILSTASNTPVPANVERQLREWIDRCRHVAVSETVVIRCPDAATATRVLSASAGQLRRLSDTVVELVEPRQRGALMRRLREEGIFPEDHASAEKAHDGLATAN